MFFSQIRLNVRGCLQASSARTTAGDNGSMKFANISAEEFSKYKLNKGDLLFIRSNGSLEHIGKVGLFDLDGDYALPHIWCEWYPTPKSCCRSI